MQTQLIATERLAAIGEVVTAVAHGIRNPLASIRAAIQVALLHVPLESRSSAAHNAPLVPWRQVTVRQARAGSCWAKAPTLSGRCRRVRRTSVGGRPCPRYFGGGSGAPPGAHTVVSVLMPTTYAIACAVSASRKAVTTP